MEVIGRIKVIGQPQNISSSFRKRELVVTTEEQYPQDLLIEFTQDRVNLLDTYQIGEPVKVSINLRGREWVSPQGEVRYFNTIQGWRIEKNMPTQMDPMQNQYAQQPGMGQQMPNQYGQAAPQQGGFNQTNQYAQQQQNTQFPPAPSFNEEDHDDLPF